jgi:galactokinase
LSDLFAGIFRRQADATASAPGRVNLIGEHTDYNGGYVLPVALCQTTDVQIARRRDSVVRSVSLDVGPRRPSHYKLGRERVGSTWNDYLQGITWALRQRGYRFRGFDCLVSSSVPLGKGLSSSASLEVAVCRSLRSAYRISISDLEIAMVSHQAETMFVGAPVGVMDPMVCSLGDTATALFLKASTGAFEKVPMPPNAEIGIIDSGIAHHHATGGYRVRRQECEEAARLLGVAQLSDLSLTELPRVERLADPLSRRVRHVITENARVLAAVAAMRGNDVEALGRLFFESHASMRDDFNVSLPEIDILVSLARADSRVLGARLTGGGFGGCVVLLCRTGEAASATALLAERYRTITSRQGCVLVPP